MIDKDGLQLDKPRRTPDHPTKSHVVKTRVDGKEKIIRFGEQGASTAGKPKQGESERMTAKRASFKSRHAKNIAKGKSSAAYWADRVKWATGGSVELEDLNSKYEGLKKPDFSLLNSFKGMIKTLQSRAEETQGQEFDPLETLKPTRAAPTLEDLYASYGVEPAAGPASVAGIAGHAGRVEAGVTPPDALSLAASQMGLTEGGQRAAIQDYLTTGGANLDPATTAWCAAFVNSTLQQTGVQGTGSNMARSFLDWGQSVDQPQEGDLAVFSRGDPNGPYGHVGFFKGYDDQGNVLVLGGNQGDAVSIASYPRESLLGFRRAGEAAPQKFAEGGLAELTQKYDRGGEVPKPERGEPETNSLTGFPEIDRMIVALGNVNQMFNPVEAIGESMDASKQMLAAETPAMDRVAALGRMLSGVGGVIAPVATAARAGTPAAAALMESLLGGSPATTAMGDTAKDIGRAIVERANQRGPVPVMGSNFGNVLGDAKVTPGIEAADRIADMLRTGRADEITDELADQADPQRLMHHYKSGNTGMDLPMDYASRMERSKQMGFGEETFLHGTPYESFNQFKPSEFGAIGPGVYVTKRPVTATDYARGYGQMNARDTFVQDGEVYTVGGNVVPVRVKGEQQSFPDWTTNKMDNLKLDGMYGSTYKADEAASRMAEEQGFTGVQGRNENSAIFNPTSLRSQFARFDPRLGHLAHLNYAEGGTVNANFNRDRQRDDLRTIGDTVYERRADGVLSPLSRVKYAASKPAEPETGSRTGFPEVDRMLVTLGNLNEALNPMVAIQNSQRASQRMFEPNISGWDRMAAAGDMLSNVAGVVAPVAVSARAGVPAATALIESLVGGSPTMTAVGDTARDVGRKIVERANQRGPVPVMGSNFGSLFPTTIADPYARRAADRVAEMLRTGREDEITDELLEQADPQVLMRHYESGNTGMDMPMDYASRMARAKEQGFRGDLYSGTGEDFAAFDRNAVYATDNPDLAFTYAPTEGGNIIPLMMRAKYDLPTVEAGGANWNRLTPEMQVSDPKYFKSGEETSLSTPGFEREAKREGASGVTFKDIVDIGGYFNKHPSAFGAPDGTVYDNKVVNNAYVDYLRNVQKLSTVEARFYPNLVRSKFARFDPRLSHLGNLSAGVAAGAVGLEAAQYDPEQVDKIADTVRKREFATGGAVEYDPVAVDNIINQIREVNRG
jgi:uncharacterized protein (TIGR02594 family)